MEHFSINGKGFLITGDLSENRESYFDLIEDMGGLIKKTISSKVNYVIIGEEYGWSKVEKIEEYNSSGKSLIKILNEDDFKIGLTLIENKKVKYV